MTGKADPAKQPIVHKLRGGGVIAWTTDINSFLGRNRHDNVLQACYKVRATDAEFFAAHFIEGEYTARNGKAYLCYGVYRAGFVAMMKHIYNLADKTALYLAAYDRKAEEVEKRLAEAMHAMPPALEEYLPPLNDPVVHADGMRVYATTMDVAAFFRKRHDNVLAAVREIASLQPEFGLLNFKEITYSDSHGREQPAFEMTRAGFSVAVGGFTGAEALAFRVRYVQRFEEMEATLKAPPAGARTYGSAEELLNDHQAVAMLLAGYAGQVITLTAENTKLETQVSVLEPKAAALDRLGDKAGTMNLRSAAKALGFGPDFFKRRLEQLDYLFREDGRLVAYQRHIDAGLFIHKPVVLSHRDGTEFVVSQPLVTARGLAKLAVAFGVGVQAVLGRGVLHLNRDDSQSDGEALH